MPLSLQNLRFGFDVQLVLLFCSVLNLLHSPVLLGGMLADSSHLQYLVIASRLMSCCLTQRDGSVAGILSQLHSSCSIKHRKFHFPFSLILHHLPAESTGQKFFLSDYSCAKLVLILLLLIVDCLLEER